MPRFLLPILILALLSFAGLGGVVLRLSPGETLPVILFLITLFLSLVFTLSLTFFFFRKKFFFKPRFQTALGPVSTDDDLRLLFRASFRWAFLVSGLAVALLVLRRLC